MIPVTTFHHGRPTLSLRDRKRAEGAERACADIDAGLPHLSETDKPLWMGETHDFRSGYDRYRHWRLYGPGSGRLAGNA